MSAGSGVAGPSSGPPARAQFLVQRVQLTVAAVVVHYHLTTADERIAVVDIWRFENGQIVEHWDVKQPVAAPQGTR